MAARTLRFFDADGTPLAYEIEQWNEAGTSYVWVKVPQIDASSATDRIWMYYGNATCASGANPSAVWNSGYAGVWHLSESQAGTGNTGVYKDSTSPHNDGTDNVSATGKEGQVAGGQQFAGTGEWIEVPHDASLNLTGEMTISFWIKPTENTTTFNRVVEKGMWGYQTSYYFGGGNGSNDLTFYLNNTEVFDTANNVLTVNAWQQATVTYTSAGEAKLFLNGVQIASGTYTGPITGNTGPVYISHPNATYDFPGYIDEVRIENVARSDDWVKAQYKSMANTFMTFGGPQSAPAISGVLGNDTDVDGDARPCRVGLRPGARQLDPEYRRDLLLHAGRGLERDGQLHLQGQRRIAGFERCHRFHQRQPGQRRAGDHQRRRRGLREPQHRRKRDQRDHRHVHRRGRRDARLQHCRRSRRGQVHHPQLDRRTQLRHCAELRGTDRQRRQQRL